MLILNYPVQNSGMFIYVDDCDEVYKKALINEALPVMEPSDYYMEIIALCY